MAGDSPACTMPSVTTHESTPAAKPTPAHLHEAARCELPLPQFPILRLERCRLLLQELYLGGHGLHLAWRCAGGCGCGWQGVN